MEDTTKLDGMPPSYDKMLFTYLTCEVHVDSWSGLEWTSFSFKALNDSTVRSGNNMFYCPTLTHLGSARDSDLVMFSWLRRYTDSADTPLESEDAKLTIGMGFSDSFGVSLPKFETTLCPLADNSGFALTVARGEEVESTRDFCIDIAVCGEHGTTCAYAVAEVPSDTSLMRVRGLTKLDTIKDFDGFLVPWTGVGATRAS